MFDSHCHLHDARVLDADQAIERARAAGVRELLLAGVDPDGWLDEERLARRHPGLYLALGVHPQRVAELGAGEAHAMVRALAARLGEPDAPAVHALGETGLDAVGARKATLDLQEAVFREQLALARERDLPVVLHILHAHGRALSVLSRDLLPRRGGVVHSWSGAPDLVPRYLALGLHVSFAGFVTRPEARRLRESVTRVPRERLLVETDAPDQAPVPHLGEPNEPARLPLVVAAVAALRGETEADVACYTADNARRLLGLPEEPHRA